jgi:hypothetical protein
VFGKELARLAPDFPKLVVLDTDVAGGTGVHHFRKAYPEKLIQFSIAEQNMMAAAGGLAATGMLPIVSGFACFLERAFEQTRLSIAYSGRNVKIVTSHPGMTVISLADPIEMRWPHAPFWNSMVQSICVPGAVLPCASLRTATDSKSAKVKSCATVPT